MVNKKNKRGNMPNVLAEEMIPANLNFAQAIIVITAKKNYAVHQKDGAAETISVDIGGADRKILQTNLGMYKKRLLQFMLVLLLFSTVSCKDEDIETKTTPKNPLVGEWYEVGSTENSGRKVVFTETHMSAYSYSNNDNYKESVFHWYNVKYDILPNNEIKLYDSPESIFPFTFSTHITNYAFNSDTLFVEHFIPTLEMVPYPDCVELINLIKRSKNEK